MDQTLMLLRELFAHERRLQEALRSRVSVNETDEPTSITEVEKGYEALKKIHDEIRAVLAQFAMEPPYHDRFFSSAEEFAKAGDFESSVMIMTKYPDLSSSSQENEAQQLQAIINQVYDGIQARGYTPRIAYDESYHGWIWDNVQQYLLGSSRGVAILEDKYEWGSNPNVALEMGWMLGLGRKVLVLREQSYFPRADFGTLFTVPFDWNDPAPGIDSALDSFLPAQGAT